MHYRYRERESREEDEGAGTDMVDRTDSRITYYHKQTSKRRCGVNDHRPDRADKNRNTLARPT
jgi:hypothetical protein